MMCNCGVDHWLHAANGLHGIVGMFRALVNGKVPPSETATKAMKIFLDDLNKLYGQVSQVTHLER